MNPLVVVNYSTPDELPALRNLARLLGPNLVVVTTETLDFTPVWLFDSMDKSDVEWTKRLLRQYRQADASYDCLIKIDPDTEINTVPLPDFPKNSDVAGDFRKAEKGWVWFGACQYFTNEAVDRLLADRYYVGITDYQDTALARSVIRCRLGAVNMPEVNGWNYAKTPVQISHPGRSIIVRPPFGRVIF